MRDIDMHAEKPAAKKDARAWDALTPPLAAWILDAVASMGFARMTPVQAHTLPSFLGNKDVVVEVRQRRPDPAALAS